MKETRMVCVNKREIPILITDEKEALLAAKAAGGAIVGLWRPGMNMEELSGAGYVVEDLDDLTEEYLERVARRHLGLPWKICETEHLLIREMFGDDFDEIWEHKIGRGFQTVEEFYAYTKNQYAFYEFGFWAVVEKKTGALAGVAGLTVPAGDESGDPEMETLFLTAEEGDGRGTETLELGYHMFPVFRRKGYGRESCEAILKYGRETLLAGRFLVRIRKGNEASKRLAESLGFHI